MAAHTKHTCTSDQQCIHIITIRLTLQYITKRIQPIVRQLHDVCSAAAKQQAVTVVYTESIGV